MNYVKQACLVILVLAGLAAVAQTPPASQPPKAGETVLAGQEKRLADPGLLDHGTTGGTNVAGTTLASLSGYVPDDN